MYPLSVMFCGILRQETFSWGCDIGVPDVRQDSGRSVGIVCYNPCAEFVGRALQTKCDIWPFWKESFEFVGLRFWDVVPGRFSGDLLSVPGIAWLERSVSGGTLFGNSLRNKHTTTQGHLSLSSLRTPTVRRYQSKVSWLTYPT